MNFTIYLLKKLSAYDQGTAVLMSCEVLLVYCHLKLIGKNQLRVKYNDVHEFILFDLYCDSLIIFISVMAIAE
jgi:hypothetical protein